MVNVFEKYQDAAWPFKFSGTLTFTNQVRGGTPSDPRVAEGWLRSKMEATDEIIQGMIAEVMESRGVDQNAAIEEVKKRKMLNGFKKDSNGLYLEGRTLKAGIKEAAMVCVASGKLDGTKWGKTNKGLKAFVAEHIVVKEDRLYLKKGRKKVIEPDSVEQKFVHTFQGNGISYEEAVTKASLDFTVASDWEFTEEQYAMIFLTGGEQGLGSSRSQGFGRYTVTKWEVA